MAEKKGGKGTEKPKRHEVGTRPLKARKEKPLKNVKEGRSVEEEKGGKNI